VSLESETPRPERRGLASLPLAGHVGVAALTGLVFGAVDAAQQAPRNLDGGRLILAGAATVSFAGALGGLLQAGAAWALRRLGGWLGAGPWFERCTTRDPLAPREPVIRLHAAVLAGVTTAAALLLGLSLLLIRLETVVDPKLVRRLVLVAVGGGLLGAAAAGLALAALLTRLLRRLDARVPLPWPPGPPALRYALHVAAPAAAALRPTLITYGAVLGPLALPLWIVLFVAVEGLVARLALWPWPRIRPRIRRASRWMPAVLAALWLALLAGSQLALAGRAAVAADLGRGRLLSVVLPQVRAVTDVDRDGVSALFGGADCAAFNGRVHPAARDQPGNGVDEDCDGKDAVAAAADPAGGAVSVGPTYYDGPGAGKPRRYNVLWVIIDAVRADHASMLGYRRRTMPYMERLARESLLFSAAYSQSSSTLLSIPSMMAGRDPSRMQWKMSRERPQSAPENVTLGERLEAAGYRTGLVGVPYFQLRAPGVFQGFKRVLNASPEQLHNTPSAVPLAISFLEEDPQFPKAGAPFFLTLYLAAPHDPYVAHPDGYPDFGKDEVALYDHEIVVADRHAGIMIDYLRYMPPVWDNTIVVVTADHGEEFQEHGGTKHSRNCYRESLHVPLIVRVPGLPAARVGAKVALTDIVPTLVELLGLERPGEGDLDGHSLLLSALAPDRLAADRPMLCAVLASTPGKALELRQSVSMGQHKLVQNAPGSAGEELYDSEADPGEQRPIPPDAATSPIRERLRSVLSGASTGNLPDMQVQLGD